MSVPGKIVRKPDKYKKLDEDFTYKQIYSGDLYNEHIQVMAFSSFIKCLVIQAMT